MALICLFINIGILSVTKYTNFVIQNINDMLHWSFRFTYCQYDCTDGNFILYISDYGIYKLMCIEENRVLKRIFFKLALFVSFFPQLVQGPISRFHDLSETLFSKHYFESNVVVSGLMRILWGIFQESCYCRQNYYRSNNPDTQSF